MQVLGNTSTFLIDPVNTWGVTFNNIACIISTLCVKFSNCRKRMVTLLCILQEYLSGKDLPQRLHLSGLSEVCSFCTWMRRSVLRPHLAGHNSQAYTGFSDTVTIQGQVEK